MADPLWPSTVPSEPEIGNYHEAVISGLASFKPDAGPPTAWRVSILDSIAVQASFILHSDAERDAFKAFFRTTLRDGKNKFIWSNPAYDVPGVYRFDPENPPQFTSVGAGRWRLGVSMIKLGDVLGGGEDVLLLGSGDDVLLLGDGESFLRLGYE